jgi:hypothetical protein
MVDTKIPTCIKESYELALKRRSKIENAEIIIMHRKKVEIDDEVTGETIEVEKEEESFKGFANVIPIRGKDSSLDYYIMVLSQEYFS